MGLCLLSLQRWSKLLFGEVLPTSSLEMFDNHLAWVADQKRDCTQLDVIWTRARKHIASLALFHGYLPANFTWQNSQLARRDLRYQVADRHAVVNTDTDGRCTPTH